LNSRERVISALEHKEPDRVPVDLGGMRSTGIMGIAYNKLKSYLGIKRGRTRIYDWIQQLAEPETEILEIVGADVLPVSVLISRPKRWRKSTLPDGSPCEFPESFLPEVLPDGSKIIRNDEGKIIAKMPKDGYYFDSVYHPLEKVTTIEELEESIHSTLWSSSPIDEETVRILHDRAKYLYENTDYALMLNDAGGVYEWAQDLMGWSNFLINIMKNPELIAALLDKLVEANIKRLERILPAVNGYVQLIQIGDDLGMQGRPQISPRLYREIVKPRHKKLYRYIKENVNAYLFLHTCGSVYEFIKDFIEMGVDAINPVQVSAKNMESERLKEEFGDKITFWGGGCDTQKVLPFGTTKDVEEEVKKRIRDFAPNGGFVFSQVHNIQVGTPPENIMAMYNAVKKYGKYPISGLS